MAARSRACARVDQRGTGVPATGDAHGLAGDTVTVTRVAVGIG